MSNRIMAHLVAFFPHRDGSLEVARGLIAGGAHYLEVQFPFSDPTADGPLIQKACDEALKQGFTVHGGLRLVSEIRAFSDIPVFIMGYANTVYFRGVERFMAECREAGVRGLIIPDLPPGYDEGLYSFGAQFDLAVVPVICPTIGEERLDKVLDLKSEYVYATLRTGTTGAYSEIGEKNISFLRKAGSGGSKLVAGFGISTRQQVEALAPHVYASVVGSAFIREILSAKIPDFFHLMELKMRSLIENEAVET
ncbi:MAG: hypothetical protein AMS17_07495 [Spirochaetes bacterium DG_61]|nr:MAG: hypothetical protein AMS17_07495 [Spirochaetes bacterium DG_61]